MLWKLADNVKYEDDCEVSFERSTKKREEISFLRDIEQKFVINNRHGLIVFNMLISYAYCEVKIRLRKDKEGIFKRLA